jgi:hypothetical protein
VGPVGPEGPEGPEGPTGATGPATAPTLPTVVSVGTEFSGTGVPTATLPGTHAADDILVLILQSANDAAIAPPAGYTQLGPENGIGAAAVAGSTKLSIFWKRDGGSESAPTIPDSGDHTYGVMLAIRGCVTTGDPFHFLGNAWKFTASTTGTSPKGATTVDSCLILDVFAHAIDNASAQGSSPTNADLGSVTESFDDGTTDGTGGGIYVLSGTKAAAGPIAASTVTWANSSVDVSSRIAFLPADMVETASSPRPTDVQTFIGSPTDLDDVWTKPSGARRVHVQLCDGGGSGSGGNTTTTAAGGGGGGGGGYDEAFFAADELAATVTVHAGKGGAVGTALNQAGNVGVVSQFEKGGRGPLTSAYRIAGVAATAAASADGGNGGSGSGGGRVSPAVATTRLSLEVTTDGVAYGPVGGRGGSGTTAPTGGSPAQYGGGGGESGADADAALTGDTNGYSLRGGGGGGGGRTNTNIPPGGHGGGAPATTSAQGAAGTDSTHLPYGGSGGVGGGSSVVTGGTGGFPGGGGGGGAGVAGGFGGRGGHGVVVVTTYF